MRFWIILVTVCSLLSLPFSGSMAADNAHHSGAMESTSALNHHMPTQAADDAEDCPASMPVTEMVDDDCCADHSTTECGSCPPDCGHCAMSDHGSTAALTMLQTLTPFVVASPVAGNSSFYQRLMGQPTPPPIIS